MPEVLKILSDETLVAQIEKYLGTSFARNGWTIPSNYCLTTTMASSTAVVNR